MSIVLSYDHFITASYSIDRGDVKLSDETLEKFNNIKKKLSVKDSKFERAEKLVVTQITKQVGSLSELFKLLNKVTDKTYEKLKNDIVDLILNTDDASEVCESFFKIINANSFYCRLYAKLYYSVIENKANYKDILRIKTNEYIKKFDNIEFVSSTEDYDAYCLYVKQIDTIKNFTSFLVQCAIQGALDLSHISILIQTFQETILGNIYTLEETYKNEVYVSNIHILIKEIYPLIKTDSGWKSILSNHKQMIKLQGEGKTKKMAFNLMDISDLIK